MSNNYRSKLSAVKGDEHRFAQYVRILGKGKTGSRSLTREEAYSAMQMILSDQVEDIQLGAFLMLLRVKEESPEELAGFITAARNHIQAPADLVELQLDWSSYAYMPLEFMCPELQRIIDLRSYLGLRSPVHTLSRLLNPLRATHSMQSIFHPSYGDSHQQAAIALGQENAAVFKGEGGEIERRPEANCAVKVVTEGKASEEFWPKMVEGRQALPESLNVQDLIAVWRWEKEVRYALDAIIGTLAIALSLLNKADNQQQAMSLAQSYWQQRNKNRL